MSSARRLLVLLGFALMVAGILLLVTQEEEIFVALSVLGFVVVVAAVPRLERQRSEASGESATAVRPASGVGQPAGAQPGTGNVTAVPSEPTLEQPAVSDSEIAGDGQQPPPEPSEPPPAALEPAPPAPPVATPTPPEPEPAAPAGPEPAAPAGPEPAESQPEPASSFTTPNRWGTWEAQAPPPPGHSPSGPGRPSTRTIAVAGTAAAATAALWAWRRVRR